MTDEEELDAIRQRMSRPLSREQIVANELAANVSNADLSTWTNDDYLRLAHQIIETVTAARDISGKRWPQRSTRRPGVHGDLDDL